MARKKKANIKILKTKYKFKLNTNNSLNLLKEESIPFSVEKNNINCTNNETSEEQIIVQKDNIHLENDFDKKLQYNQCNEITKEIKLNECLEENKVEQHCLNDIEKSENNSKIDDDIYLSEEIINEKVKGALEYKSPKQRKKSIVFSICMLVLNIVFMIIIVKNLFAEIDGNIFGIFETQGHKLWWLAGGVFAYILSVIMQIIIYKTLLKNLSANKNVKVAYDTAIVGRYYDNVTPFAVGGQPMQIVSLIKNNVSPAVATGIPLIKMVINTGMSAISALIFFAIGLPILQMDSPLNKILLLVIEVLGIIGLVITLFITIFMFLISSGTLITRSFISGVLRLGYKLKFIKNYRKTYRKVLNQVAEYKFSIKYLLKNKKVLFKLIFVSFIENVSYALIPFFVIMSFTTGFSENILFFMFICVTKYFLCTMASCFIPLPGGTGMMEVSFIILFGMVLGDNIAWALLFWRFLSYYLVIIHGFTHELSKIISVLIKNRKNKSQIEDIAKITDN